HRRRQGRQPVPVADRPKQLLQRQYGVRRHRRRFGWRCTGRREVKAASLPPHSILPLEELLRPIRDRHGLPALAAAVIREGRLAGLGAVGVRKAGTETAVTRDDEFHIGSCTKAMTATVLATLVDAGKLRWETTLPEALPDLAETMHAGYRKVTLLHLLAHRAGLVANAPPGMPFARLHELLGTPTEQRQAFARALLAVPPQSAPGEKFLYSNAGYAVAALVAERAAKKGWRELMRERVFRPLGMASAGFGAMGTPGKIDQPWQHVLRDGKLVPIAPGPRSDNPPAYDPAGRVHCSMADWAKFVAAHLDGPRGRACGLRLKPETWRRLHTPPFGGDYALGWGTPQRSWGGGAVLTHAGSNTMNYAVVWVAPKRDFAVLVATNLGGGPAPKACDEAAWLLIQELLLKPGASSRPSRTPPPGGPPSTTASRPTRT
ncbi:MAG TPA: serine hydrolase domain-containing protein, partial [Phycisphaerae bacterium]|nr:serine hydrolase domain-containing protein [Phycisphaerae bacterium]